MAKRSEQDTHTGSGDGKAILAEKRSMAGKSKPSPSDTGSAQNDTKPVSVTEALSLWQTGCFDLQSYGFKTAILATGRNEIIFMFEAPASIGKIGVNNGHIVIDGVPVSEG